MAQKKAKAKDGEQKKPAKGKKPAASKKKTQTRKKKDKVAEYKAALKKCDGLTLMSVLLQHVEKGNTENVRVIVDSCVHKGDPDAFKPGKGKLWAESVTDALPAASGKGDAEIVRILLDAGADVETLDGNPLNIAAMNGHKDVVDLLVERGADVNAGKAQALRFAADKGHTDIVKSLLKAGADVHANDDGALEWAACHGHAETVDVLLEAGANVSTHREFALRNAAANGHNDVVRKLLAAGADIDEAISSAVQSKERVKLQGIKLAEQGGWSVLNDNTIAHTEGRSPEKPALTVIFNFMAKQAHSTMAVPGKDLPSDPVTKSFDDFEDKALLEEAGKKLEEHKQAKKTPAPGARR